MISIAMLPLRFRCSCLAALMFATSAAIANPVERFGSGLHDDSKLPLTAGVLDKTAGPRDVVDLDSLIAWHCQARSDVSVGSSVRPYRNAACEVGQIAAAIDSRPQ